MIHKYYENLVMSSNISSDNFCGGGCTLGYCDMFRTIIWTTQTNSYIYNMSTFTQIEETSLVLPFTLATLFSAYEWKPSSLGLYRILHPVITNCRQKIQLFKYFNGLKTSLSTGKTGKRNWNMCQNSCLSAWMGWTSILETYAAFPISPYSSSFIPNLYV